MKKYEYREDFFKRFCSNGHLNSALMDFGQLLGNPRWIILKNGLREKFEEQIKGIPSKHILHLHRLFNNARRKKNFEQKRSSEGITSFVYPLIQGDSVYGYIGAWNVQKEPTENISKLFISFVQTIMDEVKKEMELTKLYETIRPRTIALSTVHTVHRLISSTLNLDELLPKIARLCLQVLRAYLCEIFLFDEQRNFLLRKTCISVDRERCRIKKIRIDSGMEWKTADTAIPSFKPHWLLVPLVDEDVIGVVSIRKKAKDKAFSNSDHEILTTFTEQAVIAIKNAQLYEEQEKITLGSIKSLAIILQSHSPEEYATLEIFVEIVTAMGEELNLSENERRSLYYAVLLHDAGRVAVPETIISKPSKLTNREYKIIQRHPKKSADIVQPLEVMKPAIPIILHHHERYDGTGYPKGLKGEEIPIGARIMAVADAFEAMIRHRPYRKPRSIPDAIDEISRHSGTQFDPLAVKTFLKVVRKKEIWDMLFARQKDEYRKNI